MAKTKLEINYEGKDYCLEYTLEVVKDLERRGLVQPGKIDSQVTTFAEELFCGAFECNHKDTKRKLRQKIWRELAEENEDGEGIVEVLQDMYSEALESVKPQGNVSWKKTN